MGINTVIMTEKKTIQKKYRECDNCQGTFKLTKIIRNRFIKDEAIKIYCPYCNSPSHHEITQDIFIGSERGYIK
jgi:Zn finger protein HypA/HybF involved in hydrogenase expression